jgi:mRNA-degrading endonuclease RelE of RelBE toxin-antitoxin system
MKRFAVDWEPDAEDELARIWMQADDPSAVARAQVKADQLLASDPIGKGQHVSEGLYQIHVAPLVLTYSVDAAKLVVQVAWVRSTS